MFVIIGSDCPALKYLNRYVVPHITSIWHDLGLELMEVKDEQELGVIEAEGLENKESTKRMLKLWREKKIDASWNTLIKALRNPVIGLYPLALQLEGKLLPDRMYNS